MSKSIIELYKENMKFAAAHFTIFSATERERLHGHNYQVYVALEVEVQTQGFSFDYRLYKQKLYALCQQLHHATLLPTQCKHLEIVEDEDYFYAIFGAEKLPFLKTDVVLLPLRNITVEELSRWFVEQLTRDKAELKQHSIQAVTVKVFSAPGQSGSAHWNASFD
jgi:6-pyruvoyltetrahydropterin/6-carboxytetrahydropterin synthase